MANVAVIDGSKQLKEVFMSLQGGLEPNVYGCGGLTETMGLLCFVGCLVYFYLLVSFGWECPLGLLPLAPST